MLFFDQGSRHAFVEIYRDQTTRAALAMQDVEIQILHYDDALSPNEIIDVVSTPMISIGDGKYVHFQDFPSTTFLRGVTYHARVRAVHPTDLVEEISEQVFQVTFPGEVGRLQREHFTEGDRRVFAVEFRDQSTRLPLDMGDVTIEVVYYDDSLTPIEQVVLAPTVMVSLGSGRYVHALEIDSSFPPNTEFFVRYRGTHPTDLTEEVVEEIFSSFETPATASTLDLFSVEPF